MFENIIGQDDIAGGLLHDVETGRLPASILFSGPEMSGKLTTALELARGLMCSKRTAAWSCDCYACRQNRLLENPYLLLLGWRNFEDEIRAAAEVLRRSDSQAARYLFVRAVRKLEKRFDAVLWEGVENKISPVIGTLEELEECIGQLLPGNTGPTTKSAGKTLDLAVELSANVIKKAATDGIPVHQIRKASYWCHTTNGQKVVILENADRMLPGSANALLKTLEEPPVDTYFILLTSNKERIMPTLRSRLRLFQFRERSGRVQEEIIHRIFRETSDTYDSLKSFFLSWGINQELVSGAGKSFLKAIGDSSPDAFFAPDRPYVKELEDPRFFTAFINELENILKKSYLQAIENGRPDRDTLRRYELWNSSLGKQKRRLESYNMNPVLLLHSLYREVAVDS